MGILELVLELLSLQSYRTQTSDLPNIHFCEENLKSFAKTDTNEKISGVRKYMTTSPLKWSNTFNCHIRLTAKKLSAFKNEVKQKHPVYHPCQTNKNRELEKQSKTTTT